MDGPETAVVARMELIASLIVAFVVGAPLKVASACEPRQCVPGLAAPAEGSTVPANAPALALLSIRPPIPNQLQLLGPGDVRLAAQTVNDPANSSTTLLLPDQPLAPNTTYRLAWEEGCLQPPDGGVSAGQSFVTGGAAPLPGAAGSVSVGPAKVQQITVATGRGSCTVSLGARTRTLDFQPSAELSPYLPLAQLVTTVDGKEWARSEYGSLESTLGFAGVFRQPLRLYAACGERNPSDDLGLDTGMHHGELAVHVAGVSPDPSPMAFDFTFAPCTGKGCSYTPAGGDEAGWWLALAVLALIARLALARRKATLALARRGLRRA